MPDVPAGNGQHPIVMVVISANDHAASVAFYSKLFGWSTYSVTGELTGATTPGGPAVALRAGTPAGFPGVVPMIRVDDISAALEKIVEGGGEIERPAWQVPTAGTVARFKDPSGTIYGLIEPAASSMPAPMAMPFGDNPKPPAGSVCSLEMYAKSGAEAATFFSAQFGWGCIETMPHFVGFNPGAGPQGVFQSHTAAMSAVAYIYVENVNVKIAEIEANGGARMGDPMSVPGMGTFGYFKDPSGSAMGLIGP